MAASTGLARMSGATATASSGGSRLLANATAHPRHAGGHPAAAPGAARSSASASTTRASCRPTNVTDLFSANAYIAVAAIGMSMVIITGNIDISVGAAIGVLVTLSGSLAVALADAGLPLPLVNVLAWTAPILGGMLIAAINGFFVAYLGIPAIVVTLGMFSILKGGLILVAGGATIINLPDGYGFAQQDWLSIPVPVWIMIVLTLVAFAWMRWSRTGRSQYAVGGNAEAARLSGFRPGAR